MCGRNKNGAALGWLWEGVFNGSSLDINWSMEAWALLFAFLVLPDKSNLLAEGIPEPDLVMYGRVVNITSNANLRLGYGTLNWVFQPAGGGTPVTSSATLTNVNNQFSYILHIPCETPVFGNPASSNRIQLTDAGITFNRGYVTWNNTNLLSFVQPTLTNTTFFSADRGRVERVDLDASTTLIFDVNGLPVDWELSYFGHTGVDANADPDHDGLSLFSEYRSGADPNDPSTDLRFTQILPVAGGILLKWVSADSKFYALQRAASPSSQFLDIQTRIPATAPTNTYVDASAARPGPYLYRLRVDDVFSVPTASPLRLTGIAADLSGGIRINWLSTASQMYAVQRTTNLRNGFVDVSTGIAATPPTNTFRDVTATGRVPYFYRVRLDNGSVLPLKFLSIQAEPLGGVSLDWSSATGHIYTLQRSSNLAASFTNLAAGLSATPPANTYRDSTATDRGPYYYRLRLDQ